MKTARRSPSIVPSSRPARAPFAAVLALLALGTPACGETVCFQWTKAEGTCPSSDEALDFMGSGTCNSEVLSVDGPGAFEDDALCCYPVTKRDDDGDFAPCAAPEAPPGGSAVGAGGFSSSTVSTVTASSGAGASGGS